VAKCVERFHFLLSLTYYVFTFSPRTARREVAIDAKDSAQIEAVLAKGEPPRGDIWSFERGLDS
jgi:hypothetical protein